MQFTHPELLWAFFLLLIPLIIHLFQLRRFKKTPFTNVRLLQKVLAESRRSSILKKWLLLITRLLLLAALILGFTRPFKADRDALGRKEMVIYIDNSFSMQAKNDNGSLLETAIQDLIKNLPRESPFSLFTNDRILKNVTLKEVQNDLLNLPWCQKQLAMDEILLKGKTLFSTDRQAVKNLIVVSDFQQRMAIRPGDSLPGLHLHLVQLRPDALDNVSIDTVYISKTTPDKIEVTSALSGPATLESIPVSLYNGDDLIAKTAAVFDEASRASVTFTLGQNEVFNGKIEITDPSLSYDNELFFNMERKEPIRVMTIGQVEDGFLQKIYEGDEFQYDHVQLKNLNYATLEAPHVIILNEIVELPVPLQNALHSFSINGGTLVVIPARETDLASYNAFFSGLGTQFTELVRDERNITGIVFDHPLFQDVFEKRVTNFQFPKVNEFLRIRTQAPKILTYQDNEPFLAGRDGVYFFSAALDSTNSNFQYSPLIVPAFYSIASQSLKLPKLYHSIGASEEIDIPVALSGDNILKVSGQEYEFIPRQHYFANKTTLTFAEEPTMDGIYTVMEGESPVKRISFDYPRAESQLVYHSLDGVEEDSYERSLTALFADIEKAGSVTELWKWFVILALLFLLIEIVIQKYLK